MKQHTRKIYTSDEVEIDEEYAKELSEKYGNILVDTIEKELVPKFAYRYDGYEHLVATKYPILSETPRGYWIKDDCNWPSEKRFILKDSRKAFAYITIEDALTSYKKRKQRQIKILKAQLVNAENGLLHANKGLTEEKALFESIRKREEWLNSFKDKNNG